MITNEEKIKFYDVLDKKVTEYFNEQENVDDTICSLSYEVPDFIEDMMWYFVYINYGREQLWQNDFIDTLRKKK
jgi:hypothetical protein